jgi:transcriptional regulator with XRE-family HTH domain
MDRFPEKLRTARKEKELNQTELAQAVGLTQRSLTNYECGRAIPRPSIMRKLAEALDVTVEYLTNDATDDPDAKRGEESQIEMAREKFGSKGAREAADLLERNRAFLAGGTVDQETKDAFFQALMTAYVTAKSAASQTFTPKSKRKAQDKADQ